MSHSELVGMLEAQRREEKEQALLYRSLAARAEAAGAADLAQRFHDLHADEQHHLSRLTARVLELSGRPESLDGIAVVHLPLEGWESPARTRELSELERYRELLKRDLDPVTRSILQEIARVEEHHAEELGGKWTMA